jgi:hypothetical protein
MKTFIIITLLLLIGCVTKPETMHIDRPVYCAQLPEKPTFSTDKMTKQLSLKEKVALLLITNQERIKYEAELESIIKACSEPLK